MRKLLFLLSIALLPAFILSSCKKLPKSKFQYSKQKAGLVEFKNLSVGVVDDYIWLFGDGDSSSAVSPTHRYLSTGSFTVTLIAINENGEDRSEQIVEIEAGEKEDLTGHPTFVDADAYFIAKNVYSFSVDSPLNYNNVRGEAFAAFYDTTNFFIPVGVVAANGRRLESKDNNTYSYKSPDSSYYFRLNTNWRADGNANFPLIIETYSSPFPSMSAIQENAVMDRDFDFILSLSSPVSNADSVLWQILDTEDNLLLESRTEANLGSSQFTSASLKELTPGNAKVRVVGYNFEAKLIDNKKIYFINESSVEAAVSIQ
jgi:PKD repeat protein